MNPTLMTVALVAGLLVFAYQVYEKFGTLARMAPENRLEHIGKRLGLLFKVGFGQSWLIGRKHERAAGAMHFFIFWGFVVLAVREIVLFGEGFVHGFQDLLPVLHSGSAGAYLYAFIYNTFEVIVLAMVLIALYRRLFIRPRRLDLTAEGVVILILISGVVITDMLYDAGRYNLATLFGHDLEVMSHPVFGSEMTWTPFATMVAALTADWGEAWMAFFYHFGFWAHVGIILVFLNLLPMGKHFHVITALPNVFLGAVGYPHRRIELLDLENEEAWENESLGLNHVEQLTWKQGLDLYTCTECGRCYDICPTYVTGKPLTLKWVNDALHTHMDEEADHIRRTGRSSREKQLVGDVIHHDTLWTCTTCRACEEVCPVSIEHVPRIIAMRQGQTLMHEAQPEELNSTFKGMERNYNPWGIGFDKREDWAEGLDITVLTDEPPQEDVEVIMWVGCMGAFDNRSQKITRAFAQLLQHAGVKFAILGQAEKCTGDPARRAGNELLYQTLAQENVETLNSLGVKKIVTQCPHCLNSLANEYPQLDGHYEVYHHSQFLQKLVADGRLELDPTFDGTVTFHDPCYLGRYQGEYDAPRSLVGDVATETPVEMRRSGRESFCCGAGGAQMWMEEKIGTRVNEERVRQAYEVGATTIATACPFCMTMIDDGVKSTGREEEVRVLDIAELMLQSVANRGA